MNFVFQQQHNIALLRSEKKRATILLAIFLSGLCLQLLHIFVFKTLDEFTTRLYSFRMIWLFPITLVAFELGSLVFINMRIKGKNKQISIASQYIATAFEIGLPTFIMAFVARQYPAVNVLQSPVVFLYFIFIVLSTLRLNFGLSVFCGALASIAYISFCIFVYHHVSSDEILKAVIIFLSGVAAGFVAGQIRSRTSQLLHEAEKRHKVENLFGQQISTEVAEKMLENDGVVESKRMNVAVMFIDIRNFTGFAVGKNPEEIVHYQNAFFLHSSLIRFQNITG